MGLQSRSEYKLIDATFSTNQPIGLLPTSEMRSRTRGISKRGELFLPSRPWPPLFSALRCWKGEPAPDPHEIRTGGRLEDCFHRRLSNRSYAPNCPTPGHRSTAARPWNALASPTAAWQAPSVISSPTRWCPRLDRHVLSQMPPSLSLASEHRTVPSKMARKLVKASGERQSPSSISVSDCAVDLYHLPRITCIKRRTRNSR